jgi:adenylate cyclase
MTLQDLISDLKEVINDCNNLSFEFIPTSLVPSSTKPDSNLTYEKGSNKKGKIIETCVLYVDIRNSVELVKKHQFKTMGKVYTAFTKSILKIADHYGAKVRNIIGDRVMVVFPSEDCCTKAVHCAITINHIAVEMNNIFNVDFKCGIGVDYGEMRVIKVGTEKKGDENANYKNLIWVGYPANIASRLTDMANKEIEETYFEVYKEELVYNSVSRQFHKKQKKYDYNAEDFAELIHSSDGTTVFIEQFDKIKSFEKKKRKRIYAPILISKSVFNNYKRDNNTSNDIVNNWWEIQPNGIKNITEDVFGRNLIWEI